MPEWLTVKTAICCRAMDGAFQSPDCEVQIIGRNRDQWLALTWESSRNDGRPGRSGTQRIICY